MAEVKEKKQNQRDSKRQNLNVPILDISFANGTIGHEHTLLIKNILLPAEPKTTS